MNNKQQIEAYSLIRSHVSPLYLAEGITFLAGITILLITLTVVCAPEIEGSIFSIVSIIVGTLSIVASIAGFLKAANTESELRKLLSDAIQAGDIEKGFYENQKTLAIFKKASS